MKKYLFSSLSTLFFWGPVGILALSLSACDIPSAQSVRTPTDSVPTLRAAILSTSAGQTLRILDTSALPDALRNSSNLQAILDNSKTLYTFERNADGSLSIALPAGRRPDSEGQIELLLTNGTQSQLVRLDTSPLFKLDAQAIAVTPANTVTLGTELMLKAQLNEALSEADIFNWSVATASSGPFQPLSGNGSEIMWTPAQAGNYFVRLAIQNTQTGASSTYTTPAPIIFVGSTETIVRTLPDSGSVLTGDTCHGWR